MKRIFFVVCFLGMLSLNVSAQEAGTSPIEEKIAWDRLNFNIYQFEEIEQAKLTLIIDLIEESQTIANLQKSFRQMYESVDETRKNQLVQTLNIYEIVEQVIPIYDRHYTVIELQEIVVFFKSTAGKKMLEQGPQITQEAIFVTANYFKEKMQLE